MGIKIWLDDVRPMPQEYDLWAKTANEAMMEIAKGNTDKISFDHDLGDFAGTGYDVAKAIEYWAYWRVIEPVLWEIHSANPVGRKNIELAMKSAERFWNQ